jgi:phage terminase large subunit
MLRNTLFSIWVLGSLLFSTVGLGIFAVSQAIRVATLSADLASSAAELASTKAAHKTALSKQKAKIKAQARLRRGLVAVPVLGAGLIVYFEEQDFQEWVNENPDGNRSDYLCEVAKYSAEIVDDMVADTIEAAQNLPKSVRPNAETVKAWLEVPKCY